MRKYECRTDKGRVILTEEELWQFSRPIIRKMLCYKFSYFSREYEDLSQDAMLAVYDAMERYDAEKGSLEGYVYGVAYKEVSSRVKTMQRKESKETELTDALAAVIGYEQTFEAETGNDKSQELVDEFRETLTKPEQTALEMRMDGESNTAIYNALHPRTPRKRIGQAMTKFWDRIAVKYIKFRRRKK